MHHTAASVPSSAPPLACFVLLAYRGFFPSPPQLPPSPLPLHTYHLQVVRALFRALNAMDNFQLAAIDSLAGSARSLLLALATASGYLDADVAIKAMRVEEDYQVSGWEGLAHV